MFASDLRPCINDGFVVAGKHRMHMYRVWGGLRELETWRDVGDVRCVQDVGPRGVHTKRGIILSV